MSRGCFVPRTFCPRDVVLIIERFVQSKFCLRLFYLRALCLRTFCLRTDNQQCKIAQYQDHAQIYFAGNIYREPAM